MRRLNFLTLLIYLPIYCSQDSLYVLYSTYRLDAELEHFDNSHRTPYSPPPEVFHHGSYAQNAQLLRHVYEIEQRIIYEQLQADAAWADRCAQLCAQGYDAAWRSHEARCVETRCKAINFLNTNFRQLTLPPSQLPDDFRDIFKIQDYLHRRAFIYCYDSDDFKEDFIDKVHCTYHEVFGTHPSDKVKAHMRAEMRNWGRYKHAAFREMLTSFPVYESYMLEIGAQLEYDAEFRSKVASTRKEAAAYIQQEYTRLCALQAQRVQQQKQQREAREQVRERALIEQEKQKLFELCRTQDQVVLQQQAKRWQRTHSARATAYQRSLNNPKCEEKTYRVNPATYQALASVDSDFKDGMQVVGHALQHELMEEIVEALDTWATLHFAYDKYLLHHSLHRDSLLVLEHAYKRGKGPLYELQAALRLQEQGHTILEFSKKIEITKNLKA